MSNAMNKKIDESIGISLVPKKNIHREAKGKLSENI